MDEVIRIIRETENPKEELIRKYKLTDFQAESILNMRLRLLRKLEEVKIKEEFDDLSEKKQQLETLINSNDNQWKYISEEIKSLKNIGNSSVALINFESISLKTIDFECNAIFFIDFVLNDLLNK